MAIPFRFALMATTALGLALTQPLQAEAHGVGDCGTQPVLIEADLNLFRRSGWARSASDGSSSSQACCDSSQGLMETVFVQPALERQVPRV